MKPVGVHASVETISIQRAVARKIMAALAFSVLLELTVTTQPIGLASNAYRAHRARRPIWARRHVPHAFEER